MPEKKLVSVLINNESQFAKKLLESEKLTDIRKIFGEKLPNDSIFTLPDGSEIDREDEDDYTLSEIQKEDKVYIKSNKAKPEKALTITNIPAKKKMYRFQEVNKLVKKVIQIFIYILKLNLLIVKNQKLLYLWQ